MELDRLIVGGDGEVMNCNVGIIHVYEQRADGDCVVYVIVLKKQKIYSDGINKI